MAKNKIHQQQFFRFQIVLFFVACLSVTSVFAATATFSNISDMPAMSAPGLIQTLGTQTPNRRFGFSFVSEYRHKPVEISAGGVVVQGVTSGLVTEYLGASYAPSEKFFLDVVLPIVVYNRFSSPSAITTNFSNKSGFGDIFLRGHWRLWQTQKNGFALVPYLSLPTGNENLYIGDKYPRAGLKLAVDSHLSEKFYMALNLGVEAREPVAFFDYQMKGQLLVSGGAAYIVSDKVTVKTDLASATAIDNPFHSKVTSPVEAMGGLNVAIGNTPWSVGANGSVALVRGGDAPLFRVMVGVSTGVNSLRYKLSEVDRAALQPTLYFSVNSSAVTKEHERLLQKVARVLHKNARVKLVVVEGHTDSAASRSYNQALSLKRAAAVKEILVALGVNPSRLSVQAFGETMPAESNTTKVGRAHNRFVQLVIQR